MTSDSVQSSLMNLKNPLFITNTDMINEVLNSLDMIIILGNNNDCHVSHVKIMLKLPTHND